MNYLSKIALITVAMTGISAPITAQTNASLVHLDHVRMQWHGTPNNVGFITIAQQENEVAITHAKLLVKKSDDLKWMKLHAAHIIHALEPTLQAQGPGHGYGLINAAKGVSKHITIAAQQPDASQGLQLHATHVATSAANAVDWAEQALALCQTLLVTPSAEQAADLSQAIVKLVNQAATGYDANDDGTIDWKNGEGGLKQSLKHANIIAAMIKG